MKKQNPSEQSHETKERWAFIEKCSEEVKGWADWKKAEVYPNKFNAQKSENQFNSPAGNPKTHFG